MPFTGRSAAPANLEIIDMPVGLQSKYQYCTEAKMDRLREIDYRRPFTSLDNGIDDYVKQYLIDEGSHR
jgi:ADP-L-glycero-D-manno-heptose 6-epimerase